MTEAPQPSHVKIRRAIADYVAQAPLLATMWDAVRSVGPLRSISVDITRRCNLRCVGCYFFAEAMDAAAQADDSELARFMDNEERRGTNFATVLGGEPSLVPERLRQLARRFRLVIVTNGLKPIPMEGLEHVSIAVSAWGDRATDRRLRGFGQLDVFDRALSNYRDDPRVVWYVTLPASVPAGAEDMVQACIDQGQLVGFNYYGDLHAVGGELDHRAGFESARVFVSRMIDRFPSQIAFTNYLNAVISSGQMKGMSWGHDVCASVSADHPKNAERIRNGHPFSPHFRAYNPDLTSTRRCCVGNERDCTTCFDVWAHLSWIALSLEQHLGNQDDFANWLSTVYIFYGVSRLVEPSAFRATLTQLHRAAALSPSFGW